MAMKLLTIEGVELGAKTKQVVAKMGKWRVVGTFKVSAQKNQVLVLPVIVANDKGAPVTEETELGLLKPFKTELKGKKYAVLKAVEETKTNALGKKEKLLNL